MVRPRQRGYTYIGLLVSVAILGMMLTMVARVWRTTEQRERETQLLWIGHAYRMAIASYYALGHQYPPTLQVLLRDDRFPIPTHHLRRLYADPMTGKPDWTLLTSPTGQGIVGVASSSQARPVKHDGFDKIDESFKDADCYCAWKFAYLTNAWGRLLPGQGIPVIPGPPIPVPPGSAPGSSPGVGGAPGTVNPGPGPASSGGPN